MEVYDGAGHKREPKENPVFETITSEEITGALAIWETKNKETVVVSDAYLNLEETL